MKAAMLFMSITLVTNVGSSHAGPPAAPTVGVRTYNYAAVPATTLLAARLEADQIFRSAGISIVWIDCRVTRGEDALACTEPLLRGRDLMLRLVDRIPAGAAHIVALGESMLDREARGGVLMTVDMFPVRKVAERASSPTGTLLGRAVAHEIGHLLLGSGDHARMGLMRALWSQDELRGLTPALWGFSAREAAHMRRSVSGKPRTAD